MGRFRISSWEFSEICERRAWQLDRKRFLPSLGDIISAYALNICPVIGIVESKRIDVVRCRNNTFLQKKSVRARYRISIFFRMDE